MKYVLIFLLRLIIFIFLTALSVVIIIWHFKLNPVIKHRYYSSDITLKDLWKDPYLIFTF